MAGLFSSATLEQIRAASDIVDVIGACLPLKRAGANFVTLCPFHKEKSPSFNVNPHRQIFHCFGCHKGGDVFAFVQEYENIAFPEAVRRLAERAHIPLEFENDAAGRKNRFLKETLLQIHEQITQRWQAALAHDAAGQIARDYLAKRGVSAEAVKAFRLGYAPDAWDDTVNWARSKDHELALVEQSGLILRKEGSDHYYDRFRGRLIFPICDEQGRVIGFSGRVLAGDEKTAKYVNSPETPIFTKGKVLFALDKAKKAILDLGFAVVCEGQLDTIACHSGGVCNAVAPQGTALTAAHARILRRYTDDIILCFDGDTAGRRAAARAFDDLLSAGIPFRVTSIPAPEDPDSYIKKFGRDAFVQLLIHASEFHDFYLEFACTQQDVGTDRGRQQIVRLMSEAVHKTDNAILVDTYAQKTAQRLGVSPEAVRAQFKKIRRPENPEPPTAESPPAPEPAARPSTQEFWLLKLVLLDDELPAWAAAHLDLNWVQHPVVRQIISARMTAQPQGHPPSVTALVAELEDAAARSLLTEAVSEQREIPNPAQQLADIARRLRDQFVDRQLADLARQVGRPDLPDADRTALLRRQQSLRELKRQPLVPRDGQGPREP
jgi:DNA primase